MNETVYALLCAYGSSDSSVVVYREKAAAVAAAVAEMDRYVHSYNSDWGEVYGTIETVLGHYSKLLGTVRMTPEQVPDWRDQLEEAMVAERWPHLGVDDGLRVHILETTLK